MKVGVRCQLPGKSRNSSKIGELVCSCFYFCIAISDRSLINPLNPLMMSLRFQFLLVSFLFSSTVWLTGCDAPANPFQKATLVSNQKNDDFAAYWYQGEGEINSYRLVQSRYGEERQGDAVMVFVTEDFSKSKQVKLDNSDGAGKDKVPILKLNFLKKFVTGIYDYSMMESVFTPTDLARFPHSLKTTTTSQDWCGHTFTQFNLEGGKYEVKQFSYFEQEGDEEFTVSPTLLEDELFNRIRIDPASLPKGEVDVLPGTFYSRLQHQQPKAKKARIRFDEAGGMSYLILEYLHLDRTLTIGFETKFPHKILLWTEEDEGKLSSSGKLKSTIKSAYWNQHDNASLYLRDSLQLR